MNVSQYCNRYGYVPSSVRRWLSEGLIAGAVDGGIPEGARPKYMARRTKRARTIEDNAYDYLKALNSRRFVDCSSLYCSEVDFLDLEALLVEMGVIAESDTPCDGRWNTGYRLTKLGLDLAPSKKKAIVDWYRATVTGIVEGSLNALN